MTLETLARKLTDCGKYANDHDQLTGAMRIRSAAIAQLKCATVVLGMLNEHGDGELPTYGDGSAELTVTSSEVETALLATIALLETGTEIAELLRNEDGEGDSEEADAPEPGLPEAPHKPSVICRPSDTTSTNEAAE